MANKQTQFQGLIGGIKKGQLNKAVLTLNSLPTSRGDNSKKAKQNAPKRLFTWTDNEVPDKKGMKSQQLQTAEAETRKEGIEREFRVRKMVVKNGGILKKDEYKNERHFEFNPRMLRITSTFFNESLGNSQYHTVRQVSTTEDKVSLKKMGFCGSKSLTTKRATSTPSALVIPHTLPEPGIGATWGPRHVIYHPVPMVDRPAYLPPLEPDTSSNQKRFKGLSPAFSVPDLQRKVEETRKRAEWVIQQRAIERKKIEQHAPQIPLNPCKPPRPGLLGEKPAPSLEIVSEKIGSDTYPVTKRTPYLPPNPRINYKEKCSREKVQASGNVRRFSQTPPRIQRFSQNPYQTATGDESGHGYPVEAYSPTRPEINPDFIYPTGDKNAGVNPVKAIEFRK